MSLFAPEPHLKLSGIAIALAEVLEHSNRPNEAYETYSTALAQLRAAQDAGEELSDRERMRGVAIAHRLGEMAEVQQRTPEEVERFLTFAVEEMLRVFKHMPPLDGEDTKGKEKDTGAEAQTGIMLAELELPWWVSKTDVAAPLEALGRFYGQESDKLE